MAYHSESPPRPPFSPVTPTLTPSGLPNEHVPHPPDLDLVAGQAVHQEQPQWIDEPPSLPVNLDENTDAIALRAALSILQLQRQRGLNDIKQLDRMKRAAASEPDAFVRDLVAGKLDPNAGGQLGESKFGRFPSPQDVVRTPPIEWAKYHVVGESLDKLHQEQRSHPGLSDEEFNRGPKPPPHSVAAPYRPFADRLQPGGPRNPS